VNYSKVLKVFSQIDIVPLKKLEIGSYKGSIHTIRIVYEGYSTFSSFDSQIYVFASNHSQVSVVLCSRHSFRSFEFHIELDGRRKSLYSNYRLIGTRSIVRMA